MHAHSHARYDCSLHVHVRVRACFAAPSYSKCCAHIVCCLLLLVQHKVLKEVKGLQRVAAKLVDTYEDKDGGRKQASRQYCVSCARSLFSDHMYRTTTAGCGQSISCGYVLKVCNACCATYVETISNTHTHTLSLSHTHTHTGHIHRTHKKYAYTHTHVCVCGDHI